MSLSAVPGASALHVLLCPTHTFVTLDHKAGHNGQFSEIGIGQYLAEIQLFENLESEGAKKNSKY